MNYLLSCKKTGGKQIKLVRKIRCLLLVCFFFSQNVSAENLDCLIVPSKVIDIGSPTTGLLTNIPVDRGDIVKQGQIIAMLNSGIERTSLALAKERAQNNTEIDQSQARLLYLQSKESRLRQLFENKTVSKESLDKAEIERVLAEHDVKKAMVNTKLSALELARAEELLKQRTIESPITGVVMEKTLNVGEYINETSYILKIAQIDPLHVEVYVPVTYYKKVAVGTRAKVSLKVPLKGIYTAEVKVVDYVMDPASSTFGVRLWLSNPEHAIATGAKCQLSFDLKSD